MTLRNEVKFRTGAFQYCWGLLILTRLTVGLPAAPLLGIPVGAGLGRVGAAVLVVLGLFQVQKGLHCEQHPGLLKQYQLHAPAAAPQAPACYK